MRGYLVVEAGDVWRRRSGRGYSAFVFIRQVDETHAYPVPVLQRGESWVRTRGRAQAIGLKRFTAANYEIVSRGVDLP